MSAGADPFPIATTFGGLVRGRHDNGVCVFRGIRYGAPPTGPDRFKPSRRPNPWTAPYDAFAFGASATQMSMGLADESETSPLKDALAPILPQPEDKLRESEDCLFSTCGRPVSATERSVPSWSGSMAAASLRAPRAGPSTTARRWRETAMSSWFPSIIV